MTRTRAVLTALIVFASVSAAYASGPLNIYALIERVVFEAPPDAPSAIRVYGAFTFVDERLASNTSPLTGYLYFRLNPERDPHDFRLLPDARELALNEWRDLARMAGTGEAVAFGDFSYAGSFDLLRTDASPRPTTNLSVRPESSPPADAAYYAPGIGVVRLGEGNHGAIIKALRSALN